MGSMVYAPTKAGEVTKFYCLSCGKDTTRGQTEWLRMLVGGIWRFVGLCLKCSRKKEG